MWLLSVRLLFAAGLAWLAGLGHVHAEPAAAAESGATSYEEAIRHAVEEYSLGHWTEARFFFERAHAQNPNARTLRGLGLTCYESRNYVDAIAYFKGALANAEQPLTESMRKDIRQLLQQSEQFVTRVTIELEPANAQLEIDHAVRELGKHGAVLLDPGEHDLTVWAEGFVREERVVKAKGGEQRIQLRLRPIDVQPAVAARDAAAAPAAPARSGGSDLAPYIVIGASGAALAVGAVLVGIAASDKYAVEHAQDGATWSELEPRYNRGRTFFPVGFALMGVGLAGVAAGLTWKLWPAEHERAPYAGLRVSGSALELAGHF